MAEKLDLDFASVTPIFQQIVDRIERHILTGVLQEGEFLVSVRDLAVANSINPNTVAKAYLSLQTMSLVESVRGKGLVVKKLKEKQVISRREDLITGKVQELLALSLSLKISLDELIELVKTMGRKK